MIVLGISPLDKDATVSIVKDGKILFAAGEERFTRNKQQDGFPTFALKQALAYTKLTTDDIDIVAYPFLEAEQEKALFTKNIAKECQLITQTDMSNLSELLHQAKRSKSVRTDVINGLNNANEKHEKGVLKKTFYTLAATSPWLSKMIAKHESNKWAKEAALSFNQWQDELTSQLNNLGLFDKLRRVDHHLSHAANSYFSSGFEQALCITIDGYGSGLAGSVSIAENGKFKRLAEIDYPYSLGTFYEHVTSSLGFKPSRHEGKIVGLAAFGDPQVLTKVLLSRFIESAGNFKINQANNIYFSRYLACHFSKIDVASAYQNVLEIVTQNMVSHWVKKTGISNIVLSGGVTANVKLNQRIFAIEQVKQIYVYPNMGDGGCASGAALFFSPPKTFTQSISHCYFGPDYSVQEMKAEIIANNLSYSQPEFLAKEVAELINQGNVIARFSGRMEYGPRALGNRTIMYHAKEVEVNQWLNKKLGRTEFMPFAPVTLFEARERCYLNISGAEHTAEFMTITFDCTEEMIQQCPAAVHVDGTARPQLIKRETNPGYYDIIKEYEKISGIPSLINTSFNMHEEPIVCSPDEAIKAFLHGEIDFLVLGDFLIKHPKITDT